MCICYAFCFIPSLFIADHGWGMEQSYSEFLLVKGNYLHCSRTTSLALFTNSSAHFIAF